MGAFHVGALIENHTDRKKSFRISKLLVDAGSEHTWLPESFLDKIGVKREKKDVSFVMANGTIVTRSIGFAIVHVDKYFTIDEVVFAAKGDLILLGARTLEGLNLAISPTRKGLWHPGLSQRQGRRNAEPGGVADGHACISARPNTRMRGRSAGRYQR